MIISSLLSAVLASLSVSASAQSDAAFASSLAAAPSWAASTAQLRARPQKPAAKPPEASDDVWAKVIETVKRDGKFKNGGGFMPSIFSIEDVSGDPKADHTMNGISFLGGLNDEEQFEAMGAMIVFQDFKLGKDGNFTIDQWMFQTDVHGRVGNAGHGTAVQSPDGKIISTTPDKTLTPGDPKIQAQFDALLKHWAERKP
jgi:hypothetical protein